MIKKHSHIIIIVLALLSLLFTFFIWRKKQIDRQLEGMVNDDNYDGIKKIKKGTRVYINADDILQRMTVDGGKITPAKYWNKTKDFSAGNYVGKYVGRYGDYAHIVLRLGTFNSYYLIHNKRIQTI